MIMSLSVSKQEANEFSAVSTPKHNNEAFEQIEEQKKPVVAE